MNKTWIKSFGIVWVCVLVLGLCFVTTSLIITLRSQAADNISASCGVKACR